MKKTWVSPKVESLFLNATADAYDIGTNPDGRIWIEDANGGKGAWLPDPLVPGMKPVGGVMS